MTRADSHKPSDGGLRFAPAVLLWCLLGAQMLGGGLRAEVALGASLTCAVLLALLRLRAPGAPAFAADATYRAIEVLFAFVLLGGLVSAALAWMAGQVRGASLDPSATLVEVVILAGAGAAFCTAAWIGGSRTRSGKALGGVVAVAAVMAAVSLWRFFSQGEARLEGPYGSPNTAGTVFGAMLVLSLNLLVDQISEPRRDDRKGAVWLLAVATLAVGVSLLASASRGALAATVVGLVVSLAPRLFGRNGRSRIAVLVAASIALIIFAVGGGAVVARLGDINEVSDGRAELFALNYELFQAAPLMGHGLGALELANKLHLTPSNFAHLWSIRSAHNVYLQWLVEGGVVLAIPMFLCAALIMLRVARSAFSAGRTTGPLWALLGVDLVFLVHGLSDFALQTPAVVLLWSILLGLQFGMACRDVRPAGEKPAALVALSGLTAAGAAAALLSFLTAAISSTVVGAPLAAAYDRAATRLAARPDDTQALERSRELSRRALDLAPYDTSAALRLAYTEVVQRRRLTKAAEQAFALSYERVPLDQSVATWRIRFALEHWADLRPATQDAVRTEFQAMASTRSHREILLRLLAGVKSGEGAIVARFWTITVRRTPL